MALLACLGEVGSHVIRVGRALVILQVTGHAGGAGQVVVVIDVAIRALARRYRMRPGQHEPGGGVVELAIAPLHGVMTLLAGGGKSCMGHGCSCGVVIVLMATHARRARDVVVVVYVTVGALARRNRVCTGQREPGFRVIELSRLPGRSVMARFASLRKSASHVVGVRGVLEILQVARNASRSGEVVVVIDVAIGACPRRNRVRSGQCEVHQRVIEGGWCPGHRGVALSAV